MLQSTATAPHAGVSIYPSKQPANGTWKVVGAPYGRALPKVRIISESCDGIVAECQVGTYAAGDPEANARRIVACVNACDGMSTEEIECYGIGKLAECARNLATGLRELEAHMARVHDGYPPSTASMAVEASRQRGRAALGSYEALGERLRRHCDQGVPA